MSVITSRQAAKIELLKPVTVVSVGDAKRFVVSEAFGPDNPAGIKFWLKDNFKKLFFGLVEENVPATELMISILTKSLFDPSIIAKLGNRAETKLAYLYELLSKQPRGKSDHHLLTNGCANIFYIRAMNSDFWSVHANWDDFFRGWVVFADSVVYPLWRRDGDQVFSLG